jgi:hypothetical protein
VVERHLATLVTPRVVDIRPSVDESLHRLLGRGFFYHAEVSKVQGSASVLSVTGIRICPVIQQNPQAPGYINICA